MHNSWPVVVLGSVAMTIAATMAIAGVPIEVISLIVTGLAIAPLSAMVAGQVGENKAATQQLVLQTNGNMTKVLDQLGEQGRLLASMQPPAAGLPAGIVPEPAPPTAPPG